MSRLDLPDKAKVHMIGIGGVGVSGLAQIMSEMGYKVTGSDLCPGETAEKLKKIGVEVFAGHNSAYISGADLVVASAAVPEDNPELVAAHEQGILVLSRAEMLGRLMSGKYGIAVAGTHGKTTTTSMIAVMLEAAELDPTVSIGGDVEQLSGNAKLGESQFFLAEACEAFNSFLELKPKMAIVTNIEADHLDCHGSLDGVIKSFKKFLSQIEQNGCAIMCLDCPNVKRVIPSVECRVITYGTGREADCSAYRLDVSVQNPSFEVVYKNRDLGKFTLNVPGIHNVRNALAVIAVGCELGIDRETICSALLEFRGAGRRFEILGTAQGVTVVDDYAHHPTEVAATLAAARTWGRRVVAVFQPHLYSRTQLFADGFADSLKEADLVVLTEIYAAREKPIPGVSAKMISDRMEAGKARFLPDKQQLAEELAPLLKEGDLVVVMGAGDIRSSAEELLTRLEADAGTERN